MIAAKGVGKRQADRLVAAGERRGARLAARSPSGGASSGSRRSPSGNDGLFSVGGTKPFDLHASSFERGSHDLSVVFSDSDFYMSAA
jgi:hypothetical protein